jgi:hypothetical protein
MTQLTLQVPDPVFEAARKIAQREKISVEELVNRMLAQAASFDAEWEKRVNRGRQISRERFLEILKKAPDVGPPEWDRIE